MGKFRVAKDMLLEGGILRGEEVIEVRAADAHVLRRVHDAGYLQRIYSGTLDRKEQLLLGLPVSGRLYARSAVEAEATRLACHAALDEGVAVSLAGGGQHAFQSHGEDYCVFNDVAIAVLDMQARRPGIKIMVVDTAARQGAGTHAILRGHPDVFTYSIHVGPGEVGRVSGSMDVETVRYVEGDMYLSQLFVSLAAALESFAPDLVIWVAGADGHRNDQFGGMFLSLRDIQVRDEVLLGALLGNRIPVAVVYGAGANRQAEFTAKIHRNTVATAKRLASVYRGI